MKPAPARARRPSSGRPVWTPRRLFFAGLVAAGLGSAIALDLRPGDLLPSSRGGLELAGEFFSAALRPAVHYEDGPPVEGMRPLPVKALAAAAVTLRYAALSVALSLLVGFALGVAASERGLGPPDGARRAAPAGAARMLRRVAHGSARVFIAVTRSIHELIWAVLLLAAFGIVPAVAVIAIAIPYSGTFAKIFSEMIDEGDPTVARWLSASGAGGSQAFAFGLLPGVAPDLIAYALYRFECGLRSAAVMGFLGIPTLGYHLKLSFENLHYREVWTYLYVLGALVITFDLWSGAIRNRLVRPTTHE